MVVLQIQSVNTPIYNDERHPPIARHRQAPLVIAIAGQPMNAPTGRRTGNEATQVLRQQQCSQYLAHTVRQLAGEMPSAVLLKQVTQPSVPNRLDDHLERQCTVLPFSRQSQLLAMTEGEETKRFDRLCSHALAEGARWVWRVCPQPIPARAAPRRLPKARPPAPKAIRRSQWGLRLSVRVLGWDSGLRNGASIACSRSHREFAFVLFFSEDHGRKRSWRFPEHYFLDDGVHGSHDVVRILARPVPVGGE